jgi:ribose/xylose/arabinose/galactoside ABC-type transport system permease subunit
VVFYKALIYTTCSFFASIGGIVLTSRVLSGQPVLAEGYELQAIASVLIGGARLGGGMGTILGTLTGVLIIGVLANGLNLLNVSSYIQLIIIGSTILVAVWLDQLQQRRRRRA